MCYIGPYSTYSTYSKELGESGCSVACLVRYSTYSTYSKEPGESGCSVACLVRYSTCSTYSKEPGESGCSVACLVRYSTYSTYSKGPGDCEGSAWRLPGIASRPRHLPGIGARAKVGKKSKLSSNPTVLANIEASPVAPPARHRSLQPAKPAPRSGFFPGKKIPVLPWGEDCSTLFLPMAARPQDCLLQSCCGSRIRITNYEAVTERRKSRSGTRSRVRKNRTCLVINSTPKSLLRERKSRSGTRSRACRKKTDMPRYKFHANVEASIPSAPGTLMSHMLSPTTKQ